MQKKRKSKRGSPKSVLRLPDLDHSKASVLQNLGSPARTSLGRDDRALSSISSETCACRRRQARDRAGVWLVLSEVSLNRTLRERRLYDGFCRPPL